MYSCSSLIMRDSILISFSMYVHVSLRVYHHRQAPLSNTLPGVRRSFHREMCRDLSHNHSLCRFLSSKQPEDWRIEHEFKMSSVQFIKVQPQGKEMGLGNLKGQESSKRSRWERCIGFTLHDRKIANIEILVYKHVAIKGFNFQCMYSKLSSVWSRQ